MANYFNALSPYAASDSANTKSPHAGCGCGAVTLSETDGLSEIPDTKDAPLLIEQGEDFVQKICFTRGCLSDAVSSLTAGTGGILNMPSDYEICVEAGDQVRLIGYDACTLDVDAVYEVAAVDTDAATIELTDFEVTSDETFSSTLSTDIVPLGCTTTTESSTTNPPKYIQHCPADDLLLTGAAHARADYYNSMGVTFAANNTTAVTTINNKILPGDTIMSAEAGLPLPVKVLEARPVETNVGTVTYLTLESAPSTSGCFTAVVRRGLLFPFYAALDSNGCMDIYIPGGSTSNLQLHESWQQGGYKDRFVVGRYSIFAHWGELDPNTNQMRPRSKSIMNGDIIIRSSHVFS